MTRIGGRKDADGKFHTAPPPNLSIDEQLGMGLEAISYIIVDIHHKAKHDQWEREDIQNLKDVMTMLSDLKKKEADLLEQLSDEEVQKLVKASYNANE